MFSKLWKDFNLVHEFREIFGFQPKQRSRKKDCDIMLIGRWWSRDEIIIEIDENEDEDEGNR